MRKNFGEVWKDILKLCNTRKTIYTLTRVYWNKIESVDPDAVYVIAEKGKGKAEPVPRWMFEEAWNHLTQEGRLSQIDLKKVLKVYRTAFIISALAHLPYIEYSKKPTIIYLCKTLTHPLGETKLREP